MSQVSKKEKFRIKISVLDQFDLSNEKTSSSDISGFQMDLARHCAPTILGVKPASLFMSKKSPSECQSLMHSISQSFKLLGLKYEIIANKAGRPTAIFLYNENYLKATLNDDTVQAALQEFGYDFAAKDFLYANLTKLFNKLAQAGQGSEFPHEIGLFLGYPPSDVLAFSRSGGSKCLFSGYFKAYSNVEVAKRIFQTYALSFKILCKFLENGGDLNMLAHSKLPISISSLEKTV